LKLCVGGLPVASTDVAVYLSSSMKQTEYLLKNEDETALYSVKPYQTTKQHASTV